MANESVKSRYAKVRPAKVKRRTGSRTFQMVLAGILVVGFGLVAMTVADRRDTRDLKPRANVDHWHVYFGANVCGTWEDPYPAFEADNGMHAHGTANMIHMHPYSADAAGANATVGRFFTNGSENVEDTTKNTWDIGSDSLKLWLAADGKQIAAKKGEKCSAATLTTYAADAASSTTTTTSAAGADAESSSTTTTTTTTTTTSAAKKASSVKSEVGVVRWGVAKNAKGKIVEHTGDIMKYKPNDGEVVVLYFLPKSAKLLMPPDVRAAFLTVAVDDANAVPSSDTSTSITSSSVSVTSGSTTTTTTSAAAESTSTTTTKP